MSGHAAERTSPKGQPFIGKCLLCGKEGLTLKAIKTEECPKANGDNGLIAAVKGAS